MASTRYAAQVHHNPDVLGNGPQHDHRRDVCGCLVADRQGLPLPCPTSCRSEPFGGFRRFLPHRCLPGQSGALFPAARFLFSANSKRGPQLFSVSRHGLDDNSQCRRVFPGRQYRASPPAIDHRTTPVFPLLHPDLLNPAAPGWGTSGRSTPTRPVPSYIDTIVNSRKSPQRMQRAQS